jgi:hypothetical protein
VSRSVDDQNLVMIDLEFDDAEDARGLLAKMERIWQGPGKDVMRNPVAWIVETVEYSPRRGPSNGPGVWPPFSNPGREPRPSRASPVLDPVRSAPSRGLPVPVAEIMSLL